MSGYCDDCGNTICICGEDIAKLYTQQELEAAVLAEREETNRRANASWSLMCEKMVAIEREECAKLCEGEAKRHKESSMYEEDADYKMRFLVYAKHIETCAAAIRARGK